eukprot:TRINITY_DN653_c0_g1_i1.p2 TRINITY_DN653_c0_g1~~TRINITY_DN653_c0_g1_i1.p2  ORF type:complete len:308 (-),score=75.23 TRINITY_DN653_c0_g1_i1:14-937(-)
MEAQHSAVVAEYRAATKRMMHLIERADAHRKSMINGLESGALMADALVQLAKAVPTQGEHVDACAGAVQSLAHHHQQAESARHRTMAALGETLNAMKAYVSADTAAFETFEKQCVASDKQLASQAQRLAKAAAGAGKRGKDDLQAALAAVRDHTQQAEQVQRAQLRELNGMRQRRYARFVRDWLVFVDAQRRAADCTHSMTQASRKQWRSAAALANAQEAVVVEPRERTLIALGGGDGSQDSEHMGKVRALYDCEADEPGDLAFKVGDTITVLSKDTTSGWWTGTCGGQTGIFPSCYVVRLEDINES